MNLTPNQINNFWSKVDIKGPDDCWNWLASKTREHLGYGNIRLNDKTCKSHKVSYELAHGSITKGMHVLHNCNNSLCCNPNHLYLGTHQDNMKDLKDSGRSIHTPQLGSSNGYSKLTEKQVLEIRAKYIPKVYSQYRLAEEYNVSRNLISYIVNKKLWKHI